MSEILRIFGVSLELKKPVGIALRSLYGIGPTRSLEICSTLKIKRTRRLKDLSEADIQRITQFIEDHYIIETDLKKEIRTNIENLKLIKCYRGLRHSLNLPVRGQRTHTNARTRKKLSRLQQI